MQQRKAPPTPDDFINQDTNEYERPHQERLPKAIIRQSEPDRFDDPEATDWFWFGAYWGFGIIIALMGVCALIDMFKDKYNWLLALSWTSNAVLFLGGLALIQKYWIHR